ncbi:PEP-utilizing enzyme [Paracoccus sp. 1_MG-2023]|uniref:putative PEP-binding protein n=1 Tax=unclassified Paracoccus (in: a-proteobacteria) TaxID=2688777 RepID=UPI001C0927D0|nr:MULTISPECIES: putative PEP-binding protein [unclassified Paracoccus (in: a-proteobacteria)]MBU2956708.1 pyruvate, phosphate dikinase [Paracoccus sp. C2R09]MDO6669252.1 PEP-utilizing enzyme [Paracoccus sp. 1_MG-2023]
MTTAPTASAIEITPTARISRETHGWRSKCLQRLIRMDLPVPRSFAVDCDSVRSISQGRTVPASELAAIFGGSGLVSVRPSAVSPEWGGPGTVLNVGVNDRLHAGLANRIGQANADGVYLSFVQSYATHIARLDPDLFTLDGPDALRRALEIYRAETDEDFPQDPVKQLSDVLRSMARAWDGPTARLLRQAKGAPADAPLGLVVQEMALALGPGLCGSGTIQFIDPVTGSPRVTGRFRGQHHGQTVGSGAETLYLTCDDRGPALEDSAPDIFEDLVRFGGASRERLREEMQIEFVVTGGEISVIDAVRTQRSARAGLRVAVSLARDGVIPVEEALMRVEPRTLAELLHHQIDPRAPRDLIARGIDASPGAATGRIVFSAAAAQAAQARGESCILVRRETVPEDIRGMHAAVGVLTERGGTTSHAAVIARGIGLPCIVGATGIVIDARNRTLRAGSRTLSEGDEITIDGSTGEILAGAAVLLPPALDDAFSQLMDWAEAAGGLGVRANADTPEDALTARRFRAQGIGLCRTEHMFFDAERLPAMREMIFADTPDDRRLALERILPMQRQDFTRLFEIMAGHPVTIRLFDPPLHEFLPSDRDGLRELAASLDLPLSDVTRRVEALTEFNPMLGMRGVRLGITVPEIYDMQARAIFEAAVEAGHKGDPVVPEIMIPLVSAMKEVELVRTRIDSVAAAVRNEKRTDFTYRLGVMVETPRAALRAGDIAEHSAFMSFGTNDLTQMTYGLSRDDAGRFMGTYVQQGVFAEDPFHLLDEDGVGELVLIGVERARLHNPEITISVCGEHGGNPESIAFCDRAGIDYVSCSPFRVPIARLASAQSAILRRTSR